MVEIKSTQNFSFDEKSKIRQKAGNGEKQNTNFQKNSKKCRKNI